MKIIIFNIFIFLSISCFSQNIGSITYKPENPQAGDTLMILCQVTYGQAGCPLKEKNIYLGGNALFAEAFHCQDTVGFQVLCPIVDTFYFITDPQRINPYQFYYMPGFYDEAPCYYPHFPNGNPFPFPYVIKHIEIPINTVNTSKKEKRENQLQVHPNPTTDQVIIDWQGENYQDLTVEVYDMTGKQIRQLSFDYGNILRVNTSEWQNGLYLIRVSDGDFIQSKKLIIQK